MTENLKITSFKKFLINLSKTENEMNFEEKPF